MPERPACQSRRDGSDAVLAWLCTEDNRAITAATTDFLNSVHDSYHRYGRITDRQREAVSRFMRRHQRAQVAPSGLSSLDEDEDLVVPVATPAPGTSGRISYIFNGEDDEDDEPQPDPELQALIDEEEALQAAERRTITESDVRAAVRADAYRGPHGTTGRWNTPRSSRAARWNEAQWVYNGEYIVTEDGITFRFRIATIVHSNNNPDIVGKRALYVWMDGRWKACAFVSTTGHIVPWTAWRDIDYQQLFNYAEALVESMREHDIDTDPGACWDFDHELGDEDEMEEFTFRISITSVNCRRCNTTFAVFEGEDRVNGVHDEDCEDRRTSMFQRPVRRPRITSFPDDNVRQRPFANGGIVNPAPVPAAWTPIPCVPNYSELGTGWEQ